MEIQLKKGTLYVVATPIGNLGDMPPRAIETLKNADLVLAEDTRSFGRLAKRFGISTEAKSYFEQNERARATWALEQLQADKIIALVSDAGTPCVSDPGYHIVKLCRESGIPVSAVPGPSAAVAALSISGFEPDAFTFVGFLPKKEGKKRSLLEELLDSGRTSICYESPFRIRKTLETLRDVRPERELFLARELTKLHEECIRGNAETILEALSDRTTIKGEIVLLLRRE